MLFKYIKISRGRIQVINNQLKHIIAKNFEATDGKSYREQDMLNHTKTKKFQTKSRKTNELTSIFNPFKNEER